MNAFSFAQDKTMCKVSEYGVFKKATNGQTDTKHANDEYLDECHCQWMLLGSFLLQLALLIICVGEVGGGCRGGGIWTLHSV